MPRMMEIITPLDDVLLFHRMHAREELGRLSEYKMVLLSHPDHGDVDLDGILGQNVPVTLELGESEPPRTVRPESDAAALLRRVG